MAKNSFLIIGYFGYVDGQVDGQTIKTRNVYFLLKEMYDKVSFFDTQELKVDRLSYFRLLFLILFSRNIILLPGKNNLSKLFIKLHKIAVLMYKNIFIFAVGGWLSEFLSENKIIEYSFKDVKHVFVESRSMRKRLIDNNGLLDSKISVFPNFRICSYSPELTNDDQLFRIIFIARITPEKGCNRVFEFLEYYQRNREKFNKYIKVSFYGPIDSSYIDQFNQYIRSYSEFASYHGVITPEEVFKTIGGHDVTVLPTSYIGEGFPGTIIDSYLSGVPVIVSNWKDLPEFVINGETGFVFDLEKPGDFYSNIRSLANDDSKLIEMKRNAHEYSKLFDVEEAKGILNRILSL